jgi:hypothetical protein
LEGREGPRFSFRGFGPPLVIEVWFPRGGVRGGSFGRKIVLDYAYSTFGTNPSAESFVRSRACFLISGGRLEEHLVD